jgi:hypothetical protein
MIITTPFSYLYFLGEKIEKDCPENCFYVVRNETEILYIGISKIGVYNRWFGGQNPHIKFRFEEIYGTSTIGKYIIDNFPDSKKWLIDQFSEIECLDYLCKPYILDENNRITINDFYTGNSRFIDMRYLEEILIGKFNPKFNTMKRTNKTREKSDFLEYIEYMNEKSILKGELDYENLQNAKTD